MYLRIRKIKKEEEAKEAKSIVTNFPNVNSDTSLHLHLHIPHTYEAKTRDSVDADSSNIPKNEVPPDPDVSKTSAPGSQEITGPGEPKSEGC